MPFEPVILFFVLGLLAGLLRSDLKIPAVLYESLSIFLLLAIGLKGGMELASYSLRELAGPIVVVVAVAMLIPLAGFFVLYRAGRLARCRCRIDRSALRFRERRHLRGCRRVPGQKR